jgi:cell division protein FtsI (penicillin-binding protein 3)
VGISMLVNESYKKKPEQFVDRLYGMGLNRKLDIGIRGEGKPEIKYTDSEFWSGVSLPMMSIGYEVRMTPLQILAFYNAIANDGSMVKPIFVEEMRSHGKVVRRFQPEVANNHICSRETLEQVRAMMEGVVENGTGKNLSNSNYKIAGKTGTAQVSLSKEGYTKSLYQASFVGYFPADKPKYSCIVVVNAPSKHIYYGNLVAGPIFRSVSDRVYAREYDMHDNTMEVALKEIQVPYSKSGMRGPLENTYTYLGLPLQEGDGDGWWVSTKSTPSGMLLNDRAIPEALVPNVVDMGLKDALYLLESKGIRVEVNGRGTVRKQSVRSGERISKGMKMTLNMSIKKG